MEDLEYQVGSPDTARIYLAVIVTTAALKVCDYDPSEVALEEGTLKSAKMSDAGSVRFRKQLSSIPPKARALQYPDAWAFARAKESTVFVVSADQFGKFLERLDPLMDSIPALPRATG
jgi:hypothetical protein